MSDIKPIYSIENAPKTFRIKMELKQEPSYYLFTHPVWIDDASGNSRPAHIEQFPFSQELKHMLYIYHDAWKASKVSDALRVSGSKVFVGNNPAMYRVIDESLLLMAEQCENMLEKWLLENEWESEVLRASDTEDSMVIPKYTRLNAPRAIKVDMDYCSDPIWASDENDLENDQPCISDDINQYPFPPIILHLLKTYQELWETSSCTEHLTTDCIGDAAESDPETFILIDNALNILHKRCEDLIERWLIDNKWETKLHRTHNS
ncbi:hypothetical protein LMH73_022375 [Vibrio splendidus]|nr:hypothetical protein [Vibrio splendidus]MCC4880737.1 hypothetical protein [Vibrio splendidus]